MTSKKVCSFDMGPADAMESDIGLAVAYAKKYKAAKSDTHRYWLGFFEKALEKQVRCLVFQPSNWAQAQHKYVTLWHAVFVAQSLLTEAQQNEQCIRKTLLSQARRRALINQQQQQIAAAAAADEASSAPPKRLRSLSSSEEGEKMPPVSTTRKLLPWVASLESEALFQLIVSFL